MRISCLLAVTFAVMLGQAALRATAGDQDPLDLPSVAPPGQPRDLKLPNGKSQRDEIVKADYKKNLQDAAGLVELSGEMQLHPEQSTDAIVVHHPEAKYFSV